VTSAAAAANADAPDDRLTTITASAAPFFSRQQHFATTTSTNEIVAAWLAAGEPEVCLATADEQTRGRGREGRTWQAPTGSSLLLSLGFRPAWLPPDRLWQLAAVVPLAMADAAEEVAGLPDGAIRLKWPNDLVVETSLNGGTPTVRKLAGVLGETVGLGGDDVRAVIGIGINADWRREDFPPDLADGMSSLRDASGGRPIDRVQLLDGFLGRLEMRVDGLRQGHFALSDFQERQVTTGRDVDLVSPDGSRETVRALGVDSRTGGLVVADATGERIVHVGEILHVRFPGQGV
jgi:BirA family biotin operon repressor/biotin-[acetyl-CoA-carboxylase] ligase